MRPLAEVFNAKNLAIIGASENMGKPGAMLIETLKNSGFDGRVAGVNPRGGRLGDVEFYPTVTDIPFDVELALIIIPPAAVPDAVARCAARGVRGVVISSEGFAESGPEGRRMQEDVRRILKESGMRGIGPNTLGLMNTETGLTTSYFVNQRMLQPGTIGLAAQSGIFVGALLRYITSQEGLRLSKGLGLGNKVDVDESDALEFLGEDDQTEVVGLYIEDVRDGRRFMEAARRTAAKKPLMVVKGGRTEAGSRAVSSHTASLAVNDAVLDGALRQTGALRLPSIDDLLSAIMGFAWMPLPRGPRLALVTYSGAQAIMSIDAATDLGLETARFSESTHSRLAEVIGLPSKAQNPVDIFPDMMVHGYEKLSIKILEALYDDDQVDGIIFISFAIGGPEVYQPIIDLINSRREEKPIFFALLGARDDQRAASDLLLSNRVPCFLFPETAVRVFGHLVRQARNTGLVPHVGKNRAA